MQENERESQFGVPDPTFRLSEEERAKVLPEFDAEALERLLGMVPPDRRAGLLTRFQETDEGRGRFVIRLGDPALQAVLEEVWAPYWSTYPDEAAMDAEVDYLPGREIARQRRKAAGTGESGAGGAD